LLSTRFEQPDHLTGSSLYYAACIGFREAVRKLLDKGADVNTWGGIYGTPLRGAARFGHKMTCALLIHRGAWLESEDNYSGGTPLNAFDGGPVQPRTIGLDQSVQMTKQLVWDLDQLVQHLDRLFRY